MSHHPEHLDDVNAWIDANVKDHAEDDVYVYISGDAVVIDIIAPGGRIERITRELHADEMIGGGYR